MSTWLRNIEDLKDVIRRLHGCESEYLETVPVTEMFEGQTVWEGEVEVFHLSGHPLADTCYAWSYDTDNGKRYLAVLKLPPVESPITAVRAAIVSDAETNADS